MPTPSRVPLIRDDSVRTLVLIKMPWYWVALSLIVVGGLLWLKRKNAWGLVIAGAGAFHFVEAYEAYVEEEARQRAATVAGGGADGVPPGVDATQTAAAAVDDTGGLLFIQAWTRVPGDGEAHAHEGPPDQRVGNTQAAVVGVPVAAAVPPEPFDDAFTEKPPARPKGEALTHLHNKTDGDWERR
jgi:hypothetical protein